MTNQPDIGAPAPAAHSGRWSCCRPCRNQYFREWRIKNPDNAKSSRQRWYLKNKDAAYAAVKIWRENNKVKARASNRRYYLNHRLESAAAVAKWRKENPERVYFQNAKRYALKKSGKTDSVLTESEWAAVQENYKISCAYCQIPFSDIKGARPTMDHAIPLSRGGKHEASNIVPACLSCNSRKGDKTVYKFMENVIMAKRFTDNEKWRRPWFRALSSEYKLFWIYLLDHCDASGVWYVDFEHANFCIRTEFKPEEALRLLEKQVQVLGDGTRWFIPDFVPFQYGSLSDQSLPHKSVIAMLRKHGIEDRVLKGYLKGSETLKEKEKEEVKVKDSSSLDQDTAFATFWSAYPRKVAKPIARRSWDRIAPSIQLAAEIMSALAAHARSDHWVKDDGKFIPHPATWLNQRRWEDQLSKGGISGKNQQGRIVGGAAPVPGKYDHIDG